MSEIQFIPMDSPNAAKEQFTAQITATSTDAEAMINVLDLLQALSKVLGVEVAIAAPGFTQLYYGWEKDVWTPEEGS